MSDILLYSLVQWRRIQLLEVAREARSGESLGKEVRMEESSIPEVNTKADPDRLGIAFPFRVDKGEATTLLRPLAGKHGITVGDVAIMPYRERCQLSTQLHSVPEGWTAADRDALGAELIRALQLRGQQAW
jgi:hypothetical protein